MEHAKRFSDTERLLNLNPHQALGDLPCLSGAFSLDLMINWCDLAAVWIVCRIRSGGIISYLMKERSTHPFDLLVIQEDFLWVLLMLIMTRYVITFEYGAASVSVCSPLVVTPCDKHYSASSCSSQACCSCNHHGSRSVVLMILPRFCFSPDLKSNLLKVKKTFKK